MLICADEDVVVGVVLDLDRAANAIVRERAGARTIWRVHTVH